MYHQSYFFFNDPLQVFKHIAAFPTHILTTYVLDQMQTPFTIQSLTTRLSTPISSQVMDSQLNSQLLKKILEDDMISMSSGESDHNLLEPDVGLDLEGSSGICCSLAHFIPTNLFKR